MINSNILKKKKWKYGIKIKMEEQKKEKNINVTKGHDMTHNLRILSMRKCMIKEMKKTIL